MRYVGFAKAFSVFDQATWNETISSTTGDTEDEICLGVYKYFLQLFLSLLYQLKIVVSEFWKDNK